MYLYRRGRRLCGGALGGRLSGQEPARDTFKRFCFPPGVLLGPTAHNKQREASQDREQDTESGPSAGSTAFIPLQFRRSALTL